MAIYRVGSFETYCSKDIAERSKEEGIARVDLLEVTHFTLTATSTWTCLASSEIVSFLSWRARKLQRECTEKPSYRRFARYIAEILRTTCSSRSKCTLFDHQACSYDFNRDGLISREEMRLVLKYGVVQSLTYYSYVPLIAAEKQRVATPLTPGTPETPGTPGTPGHNRWKDLYLNNLDSNIFTTRTGFIDRIES